MFDNEEGKLANMREKYEKVNIPNQLDDYIKAGIKQADSKRRRRRVTNFSTLAAAVIFFVMLVSIRISPAFANYVSKVPGFEQLVTLVRGDKGLEAAVENEYMQAVGKSVTHNGITFRVDGMIADETRLLIFYTLEADHDIEELNFGEVTIENEKNEEIIGGLSYDTPVNGLKKGEKFKATFDVGMDKHLPSPKMIKVEVGFVNEPVEKWTIKFPVDQKKFFGMKQVYHVNKSVDVEGQKITFKDVTVYPTRIAVHVKYDEQNTKRIFHFDDLKVVNEDGEEWAGINNGVVSEGINDNEQILYLQSNYFSNPKELYLQFSSIRALDKDKLDIVLDLDHKRLKDKPNDQLELLEMTKSGAKINLEFLLKRDNPFDKDNSYSIFSHQYSSSDGKEYDMKDGIGSSSHDDTFDTEIFFSIENKDYNGPVHFKIVDYPTRITNDVRIKVK